MTEKAPDNKAREILITNYGIAPELLEYKLYQIFESLTTEAQVAVHNDIMFDIQLMVGDGMKDLVEKMAREIVNVGKAEIIKEKQ